MSAPIERWTCPGFELKNGDKLDVTVAYAQYNTDCDKVVFMPTCYAGTIEETLTFRDGALKRYRIIIAAMLGNGESSSPCNETNFPSSLDYQDQIEVHYALLRHLKVSHLESVIGFSMGGQQAYYWALMKPEYVSSIVVICGSAKTSDHNYAFLEGPTSALLNASDFPAYREDKTQKPLQGLTALGKVWAPWLFSAEWFREKNFEKMGHKDFAAYLAESEKTFLSWDADGLLLHARQWQSGDVGVLHPSGDWTEALAAIRCPVLVMPSRTDCYFPWVHRAGAIFGRTAGRPEDSQMEMQHLRHGQLAVIDSVWGHAAGGGSNKTDTSFMDQSITAFLSKPRST